MSDIPLVTPVLDARDVDTIARETADRLSAYVPGLAVDADGEGAATALAHIFAHDVRALAVAIDQAPDKNALAFFDMLGVELLPARAARAPVVFAPLPLVGDSRIPERTRVGAKVEGRDDPLVFETERAIALAQAKLVQVATVWPGRDAWADHTASLAAGSPFTLFEPLSPIVHEMYLAHETHFALAGRSAIEVRVELVTAASAPLRVVWEYWDGETWRAFKPFVAPTLATDSDSLDGTLGFTRGGIVRLATDCGSSARFTLDASLVDAPSCGASASTSSASRVDEPAAASAGVESIPSRWIRARLDAPLLLTVSDELPEIDRLTVRTVVDRTLPALPCGQLPEGAGIIADNAFAGETKLDLTKAVQPLGGLPVAGSTFLIACDEIFAKAGAEVTLCFHKLITPEEASDQQGADLAQDVDAARTIVLDAARNTADALLLAYQSVLAIAVGITTAQQAVLDTRRAAVVAARTALTTAGMNGLGALDDAALQLTLALNGVVVGLQLPTGTVWDFLSNPVNILPSNIFASFNTYVAINQTRVLSSGMLAKFSARDAERALDNLDDLTPLSAAMAAGATLPRMADPVIAWEYWNGARWRSLAVSGTPEARTFRADGPVTFTVPDDMEPVKAVGVVARWVRARLVSGGYGIVRTVTWKDPDSGKTNAIPIVQYRPPTLEMMRLGYRWRSDEAAAERVIARNDFIDVDYTERARLRADAFAPFVAVADPSPALYLGFDRALPADLVGLWLDIDEQLGEGDGSALAWEMFDGASWRAVRVDDDTRNLAFPGTIAVLSLGDALPLARFGVARWWLRARLASDGPPHRGTVRDIRVNAVWAAQLMTIENETLGSSDGEAGQVFFARQLPVLEDELLEVRELSGERAYVEEPILRRELALAGIADEDVRAVKDPRTGRTSEIWVRWRPRANLLFADPLAREYAVERTRGRVLFGGGAHGLVPPAGRDNIRLSRYRSGGGMVGNVGKGAITQLLAGVLSQGVTNPRAAEGGADGEPLERVRRRAPQLIRHRRQAISFADYEAMALEASPAVAVARALPTTHPSGRFAPGWVTVRIVPRSTDARPTPSYELREQVRRFLAARAPSAIASRIAVVPPLYLGVGVDAELSPIDASAAGDVLAAVRLALETFLHPLTGGPWGLGWPFGRDVFLSDVAALIESVRGVDYAASLALVVDGVQLGERVAVPAERLVVAGALRLTLSGAGG